MYGNLINVYNVFYIYYNISNHLGYKFKVLYYSDVISFNY